MDTFQQNTEIVSGVFQVSKDDYNFQCNKKKLCKQTCDLLTMKFSVFMWGANVMLYCQM